MAIPSFQDLMLPVLSALSTSGPVKTSDCAELVAHQLNLSEEDRNAMLPSGTQRYIVNRTGWASWHLQQAGLIDKPRRGVIEITEAGRELLAKKPERIDIKLLTTYPLYIERRAMPVPGGKAGEESAVSSESEETSPDERIEEAFSQLNDSLALELREQMAKMDPFRFEQLVVDLLFAMGYGGSREEAARVTQKSNDEGIDGVINEDRLGLDVIYVQAKRWQNTVGRPEVQSFVGALAGKQASKGVFITTSDFGQGAMDYAKSVPQKVILINGTRLAELMIEYNIGVTTTRTIALKRIDSDYFEEG